MTEVVTDGCVTPMTVTPSDADAVPGLATTGPSLMTSLAAASEDVVEMVAVMTRLPATTVIDLPPVGSSQPGD